VAYSELVLTTPSTIAGLSQDDAFSMNLGVTSMAFIGTCLSWFAITWWGRRTVFISGMAWMTGCLIIIGAVAFKAQDSAGAKWAQAAMVMVHVFAYDFTVGPLTYVIVGETSATRLRSKTVGLARNSYNVTNVVVSKLRTLPNLDGGLLTTTRAAS
jgi:SP family general alpha glucoside:H+ symporter-like MFS transporter